MTTIVDMLRDLAINQGLPVCDEAAGEIEDLEKAYGLLFKENAKLRAELPLTTFNRIKSVLASEIECSVFEQHVQPALDVSLASIKDPS